MMDDITSMLQHKAEDAEEAFRSDVSSVARTTLKKAGLARGGPTSTQLTMVTWAAAGLFVILLVGRLTCKVLANASLGFQRLSMTRRASKPQVRHTAVNPEDPDETDNDM